MKKLTNIKTMLPRWILNIFINDKNPTIHFKCPYMKNECTEYDSGSATLLIDCKDCKHYDKGIVSSKF